MSKGKIVKTEFFVYLNKELYRIAHSWNELEVTEKEIFTKYPGYNLLYGSTEDFSVYINKKTKDVLTYWFKITIDNIEIEDKHNFSQNRRNKKKGI